MEAICNPAKVLQLRNAIESLTSGELDTQKRELLSLVDQLAGLQPRSSDGKGENGNGSRVQRLSPREGEVLKMILIGRRLKEIASHLNISVKTVTTHRSRLLRKLGLEDNLGLYRYGIRTGMISV